MNSLLPLLLLFSHRSWTMALSTTTRGVHHTAAAESQFQKIASELQRMAAAHQLEERAAQSRSRNKLQPRHLVEFPSSDLFDQFARCVCQVGVIPRKELFETWAVALYVHHQFPKAKRIADLACSHGLLSWALLLLAANSHDDNSLQRSVVCVDLKMPKSAERIATVVLQKWPQFQDHWDYVEGPLEQVEPDASTLLVGIHACGTLSDKIVHLAIQGNAPLALVPCCHSKKCLTFDPFLLSAHSTTGATTDCTLTDFLDFHRKQRLEQAGYQVVEATIPPVITPKNRMFLATLPPLPPLPPSSSTVHGSVHSLSLFRPKNSWTNMPSFSIPVADTMKSRAIIRSLAGRAASIQRRQDPPVTLCISLYLPPHNLELSADELKLALPSTLHDTTTHIEAVCIEPFWHPKAQRHARTFQVKYPVGVTKAQAKHYHQELRERIPHVMHGAQVRY